MIPKELKYLETHEWARKEADDTITMGITDFAVEQLGDIVYLELPKPGDKAQKGTSIGMIESVKAASDFYAPVTGQVIEINEAIVENLEIFKTDAYGDAWLVKIKPDDPSEFEPLMDAAVYEEQLKGQK